MSETRTTFFTINCAEKLESPNQLFALTSDSVSTSASANGNSNYAASLEIITNSSVLALSQVCARWHDIALGTPSLWSEVGLDAVLWQSPATAKTAMSLLQVFLSRGGNVPLSILITNNTDMPFHGPPLQLLAQHSSRWRSATLNCPMGDLRHLALVNGNLPILETLEITPRGRALGTLQRISLRQSPRWRTCLGRTAFVCGFISTTGSAVGAMHSVLTSPIHLRMSAASQSNSLASSIGTTVRRHWPLSLLASHCHPCGRSPSARTNILASRYYGRSLNSSPSLRVPDHERADGRGANLEIITDSLLQALTRTPDAPSLVPHLESLHIRSRLGFMDDVYLAMVVSRLEPGVRRFTSLLEILPQCVDCREFDPGVLTRLRELVARGDLEMSLPAPC
ncbi:hypothetical protein B0H16DRAFT_1538552 [Mycena metata]|uniref:F-box domain-containing protein n=1 Tax=Mycena metata TaxID=1033252 RepID=A0AAD7J458_9AGAR|nr:hypothetical protein B0H16DRAFT_1538552 [Mycena metata]